MALASIQFNNNPKGIFYSSKELSGCLVLDLQKSLQVKKIYVRIKGKGIVNWKENEGGFLYRSTERYIDVNHDIYSEDYLLNLTSGQHCFNFSYLLPAHLPATFTTASGRVYYSCEAIVEGVHILPMLTLKKHVAKKPFTVIPTIPLDSLSNANVMITKHSSKVLYTCCWSVGPLKVTLRVNRGAFVPGESININMEIFNQSMMYLTNLEANLKRTVACKARACSKRDENMIISGARCLYTISPQENFVWKNGQIPIPQTPPTDLGGCQIISVTYHLKVKIGTQSTDCLSSGVTFKIPIIIGSLSSELVNLTPVVEQQHEQVISSQPITSQIIVSMVSEPPTIDAVINLDKPSEEYCPGEVISGNVTVTLKKPMEIISMKIVLLGLAECDVRSKLCEPNNIYYGKTDFLMEKTIPIFQYDSAEEFAEGEYTHSFSEELPTDLCESLGVPEVGYVRYCCLVMITSSQFIDGVQSSEYVATKEFEVTNVLPVPEELLTEVLLKDEIRNMRWLCICCRMSAGEVKVSMSLDRGGYLPGQTITCNATLANNTSLDLYEVKMCVKQSFEYILTNDAKSIFDKEISVVKYPKLIRAREITTWDNVPLRLPIDLIATNLNRCKLMKVDYHLVLTMKPCEDLCASVVRFEIPFFIGSPISPATDSSAINLQPATL